MTTRIKTVVYRCPECNKSRRYYCNPDGAWCVNHQTRRNSRYVRMVPAKQLIG